MDDILISSFFVSQLGYFEKEKIPIINSFIIVRPQSLSRLVIWIGALQ